MKWIIQRGPVAKEIQVRDLSDDEVARLNPDNSYLSDKLECVIPEDGATYPKQILLAVATSAEKPFKVFPLGIDAPATIASISITANINAMSQNLNVHATMGNPAGSGNYTIQARGNNLGVWTDLATHSEVPNVGEVDFDPIPVDPMVLLVGGAYDIRVIDAGTGLESNIYPITISVPVDPPAHITFLGLDLNSIDLHVAYKCNTPDTTWAIGVQHVTSSETAMIGALSAGDSVVFDVKTTLRNNGGDQYRLFLIDTVANPTNDVAHPTTIFSDILTSVIMNLNSVQSGVAGQVLANITYDVSMLGSIGNAQVYIRNINSTGDIVTSELIDSPPVSRTDFDFQCLNFNYSNNHYQLVIWNAEGTAILSASILTLGDGSDSYRITTQTSGRGNIQLTDNGGGNLVFDFLALPSVGSVGGGVTLTGYDYEVRFWHLLSNTLIEGGDSLTTNHTVNASGNVDGVYVAQQRYVFSDNTSFSIARVVKVDGSGIVVKDIQVNGVSVNFILGEQQMDLQPDVVQTGSSYDVVMFAFNPDSGHGTTLASPVPTDSPTHVIIPADTLMIATGLSWDSDADITDHFNGDFFPYFQVVVTQ